MMSYIQPESIKALRNRTGASMMDCKRALVAHNGNMDQAAQYLREMGLTTAANKAGRTTAEGLVQAYVDRDRNIGVLLEINCETDFVAKNPSFKAFVQDLAKLVDTEDPANVDVLLELCLADGRTVDQTVGGLVSTFAENVRVRRFVRYQADAASVLFDYVHNDRLTEGKHGVLLEVAAQKPTTRLTPEIHTYLKQLALHIAAAKPRYVHRSHVPSAVVEQEAAVYRAQALNEGKPREIVERIVGGRLETFYQDSCLLEQAFVRDNSQNVATWLQQVSVALEDELTVVRFSRFEKGEMV